jgi:hypothetical protein
MWGWLLDRGASILSLRLLDKPDQLVASGVGTCGGLDGLVCDWKYRSGLLEDLTHARVAVEWGLCGEWPDAGRGERHPIGLGLHESSADHGRGSALWLSGGERC